MSQNISVNYNEEDEFIHVTLSEIEEGKEEFSINKIEFRLSPGEARLVAQMLLDEAP